MCGAALAHPPVQTKSPLRDVTPPAKPANGNGADEQPAPSAETVHGPSFLGLAEDPKTEFHYLYEDEPPRSYAGMIFFILLLAVVGGAGYWQWKHHGFPFNRLGATTAQQSASPSEVAPAQSQDQQTHIDKPMTGAGDTQPAQPDQNKPPDTGKTTDFSPQGAQTPSAAASTPTPNAATPNNANAAQQAPSTEPAPEKPAEEAKATPPPSVTPARPKKAGRTPAPKPAPKTEAASLATKISPYADLEAAGERYLYGSGGTPQNCAKAQSSLQTAATRGNSKAQTVLGTMYATGHCVGRDLPTAYRWFARALHQDPQNSRISADLQVLWRQMSPQERQLATTNAQ
jgi:cytoskeletal protein RodZ